MIAEIVEWRDVETGTVHILLYVVGIGVTALLCGILGVLGVLSYRRDKRAMAQLVVSVVREPIRAILNRRHKFLKKQKAANPPQQKTKKRSKSRSSWEDDDDDEDDHVFSRVRSRTSISLKSRNSLDDIDVRGESKGVVELNRFRGPAGPYESILKTQRAVRKLSTLRLFTDSLASLVHNKDQNTIQKPPVTPTETSSSLSPTHDTIPFVPHERQQESKCHNETVTL